MIGIKNTLVTLSFSCLAAVSAWGQLPGRDAQFVAKLKQQLVLSETQGLQVDSVYTYYYVQLQALEAYIDSVEASDASEQEVTMRVAIKSQERKDLKADRETDLLALFTPEQQKIYAEKIKPARPQVLHFGIHNRADCKVCLR